MAANPDTQFVFINCWDEQFADELPPNVSCILAGDEEMGFLAGVAAALATKGGVHFTTSGGHIDPWIDEMNDAVRAVKDGIVVIDPEDRSPTVLLFDQLLP